MVKKDVVDRLSLLNERRDDRIKAFDLLLRKIKAFSGFRESIFILLLGTVGMIVMFLKSAFVPVRAAVADIGRRRKSVAGLFPVFCAAGGTFAAEGAFSAAAGETLSADKFLCAGKAESAVVKTLPEAAGTLNSEMSAYFSGDRVAVFAKKPGDLFEAVMLIKFGFNSVSVFLSKMFSHNGLLSAGEQKDRRYDTGLFRKSKCDIMLQSN